MASVFGAGWRSRTSTNRPGRSASPAPVLRHSVTGSAAVDDDEVEQPIEVEVDERRAACPLVADDAGRLGTFDERAVGLPDEQVAGVACGVAGLVLDIALGDEQIGEGVVVDVGELGVPGGGREHVAAGVRAVGGDPAREGDVLVRRVARGPSASVCSLLSPWLVRYTSGLPSPVRSWLAMPIPQICNGRQPSASVYGCGSAPGDDPPQLIRSRRGSSAGRWSGAGRAGPSAASR